MGIYIFNAPFLFEQLLKDADTKGSTMISGKDIIPAVIDKYIVNAYPFLDLQSGEQSYWRDVGTIDAYWAANMELIGVNPGMNLYDDTWPIWTNQEQTPPPNLFLIMMKGVDRRLTPWFLEAVYFRSNSQTFLIIFKCPC